jgi:hypothetical protein
MPIVNRKTGVNKGYYKAWYGSPKLYYYKNKQEERMAKHKAEKQLAIIEINKAIKKQK